MKVKSQLSYKLKETPFKNNYLFNSFFSQLARAQCHSCHTSPRNNRSIKFSPNTFESTEMILSHVNI